MVPDFSMIGKLVRHALQYPGSMRRDTEFFTPRKCENKWREMVLAEDSRKGSAGRTQRKVMDPTPSERAGEMIERLREQRKADIKAELSRVQMQIEETEKDINNSASADQDTLERWVKECSNNPDLNVLDQPTPAKPASAGQADGHNSEAKKEAQAAEAPLTPSRPASSAEAQPATTPAASTSEIKTPVQVKDEKTTPSSTKPTPVGKHTTPVSKLSTNTSTPPVSHAQDNSEDVSSVASEDLPLGVARKRNEAMMKLWKAIFGHEKSEPFKKPVTKREAPDYHAIIKKPICLNDVKKKLDKNEYEGNVREFMSDMALIFINAMQYNQKGSEIFAWAKELQVVLKKEETAILGEHISAMETPTPQRPPAGRGSASKKGVEANHEEEEEENTIKKPPRGRGR